MIKPARSQRYFHLRRRGILVAVVCVLLAGLLHHNMESGQAQTGSTLIRIDAATAQERTALVRLGIDIVNADLAGLTARVTPKQLSAIAAAGFAYERLAQVQTDGHVDPAFHTFDELVAELEAAAATFPDICQLSIIGTSIEGRPIYALKISDHPTLDEDEPEALLFALTHAREHLSAEMALYIIQFLTENYGTDGAITNLVNQREIWILPNVNPDGDVYDIEGGYYHSWRKNRRPNGDGSFGVDLNRNYAYNWGCCGGSSDWPGDNNYRGPEAFSEPETSAIRDFALAHPDLTAAISFHTYSELILWPFGYTYDPLPADMDPIDHQAFVAIGNAMAALNGYTPTQSSGLYITDGSSDDWLYGERGIFAFTFELYPRGASPGFYPPGSVIERETGRNRSAIEYFLGIADNPRKTAGVGGDVTPPTISITGPADGAYVSGPLHVTANATDDVGVTLVEFLVDGQAAGLDDEAPYEFHWDGEPTLGKVTIQARAYDAGHNAGESGSLTVHRAGDALLRFPLFMRGYPAWQ